MGKEEEYQKLLDDPQFKEGEKTSKNLKEAIDNAMSARETTIKNLSKLKGEVETSYDLSRKSQIGATTGTVVGSALALTGFGLSFVTGGLSLGLTVAGAVLSAAGGVTAAGANIGYLAVSTLDLKHARMAVETDQEMMEKAKKLNDELAKIVDSLAKKYPTVTRETIYAMLHDCVKFGKAYAEVLWSGYKMVDGAFDVGRTIATATGKSAASAARTTVWAGLSTTKRVVSVVGAVFDVVFIPVDLYVMIKTSIEIHKFKTTGESNSDVAKTIGKLIKQLEEHRDELIKKMC